MVNQHTVLDLADVGEKLVLAVQPPQGLKRRQSVFKSSFAYRAAEYGIDPTDSHTLLDLLLHEKFLNISSAHPSFVYNTDETTARAYLLAQLGQVKQVNVIVDPTNLLSVIHSSYKVDMAAHDSHKVKVAALRVERRLALDSPDKK